MQSGFGMDAAYDRWPGMALPAPEKRRKADKDKAQEIIDASEAEHRAGPPVVTRTATESAAGQSEGMARASAAAPEAFKKAVRALELQYAASHIEYTNDPVWLALNALGYSEADHGHAMGAIMGSLVREGIVENTGRQEPSTRPSQRGHGMTIWRSMIFKG